MCSIESLLRQIGLGAALLATASAAGADVLVVRSIGPSASRYRPGMTLPDNQQIVLRDTDVLTLLDANGSWTLQGPVSVPAKTRLRNATAAPQLTTINERRARIGAVRSAEGSDARPNLWLVDITQSGATCIVDAAHPTLWRGDTKEAGKAVVAGPNGATAEIDWAAGQDLHDWPTTLAVVPDGSYRLSGIGTAKPVTLVLKPISPPPATVAETGKALIERGCSAQLDLLVAQSATADTSGS